MIENLSLNDGRVATAARLGELWGTDPLILLDCTEEQWLVRLACAKVIERDREREARERANQQPAEWEQLD